MVVQSLPCTNIYLTCPFKTSFLRCWQRGQDTFVVDREDAVRVLICDSYSASQSVSIALASLFFLSFLHLGPAAFSWIYWRLPHSGPGPIQRECEKEVERGWVCAGRREGGSSAEASLVLDVIEERRPQLWIDMKLSEISLSTIRAEFSQTFRRRTEALKQRSLEVKMLYLK